MPMMILNQEVNRNLVHRFRGAAARTHTHFRRAEWLYPCPNPEGWAQPGSDKPGSHEIASQQKLVYFPTLRKKDFIR